MAWNCYTGSCVERRIVLPQDLPRFHRAIDSAIRLRNSVPVECGLFLLVYTVGLLIWHGRIGLASSTWYAMSGARWHLPPARFTTPILQFILLHY